MAQLVCINIPFECGMLLCNVVAWSETKWLQCEDTSSFVLKMIHYRMSQTNIHEYLCLSHFVICTILNTLDLTLTSKHESECSRITTRVQCNKEGMKNCLTLMKLYRKRQQWVTICSHIITHKSNLIILLHIASNN